MTTMHGNPVTRDARTHIAAAEAKSRRVVPLDHTWTANVIGTDQRTTTRAGVVEKKTTEVGRPMAGIAPQVATDIEREVEIENQSAVEVAHMWQKQGRRIAAPLQPNHACTRRGTTNARLSSTADRTIASCSSANLSQNQNPPSPSQPRLMAVTRLQKIRAELFTLIATEKRSAFLSTQQAGMPTRLTQQGTTTQALANRQHPTVLRQNLLAPITRIPTAQEGTVGAPSQPPRNR